ncbi:MAG: hypothetical protein RIC38_13540, partial [Chromatocurvus sp.]
HNDLARFAEQRGHGAFLIGHYQHFKVGLLYIGRKLLPWQTILHQLRKDIDIHNATLPAGQEKINAVVSECDLDDYLGSFTR